MIAPGPGTLLIAEPFLKDPNFMRTVVFLCDHQEEGSFGFVINKTFNHTLDELMNDLEELKLPVFYGGPVQMDTIHFLHQYPDLIPGSFQVMDGIYWGGDFETAISLIKEGSLDLTRIRFYIGYSGWGNGQLADELKEKSWLTAQATRKLVFHKNIDEIWKDSLKELGGDYEMMANFPIDPQLN
ncbi:MAG: YqgE/AlgH family protein [Pseudobacter sp.]|uniref:YqgE/AlgH family protein n=1 Tax=Pseudobacter sp. TaxID=2045420 RepID=UPI003F7DC197